MMPSVSSIVFALSALAASVSAHPVSSHHQHVERAALPTDWFHPQGHPSSSLFRRQDQPAAQLPRVGSAEWKAKYPSPDGPLSSDETTLPKAWVDAYKAALANGLIPQVPPTVLVQDENYNTQITYPAGFDASSPEVCSSSVQCYNATDIVKAPDGFMGIGFDDGPTAEGSPPLYEFLSKNHIRATHFLIGRNIINNPDLFLQAFRMNGDLAVHTWTHPYMTAQSDFGVLAELGWTMQVIHDSTGGRVPRYWRPSYGDMDQRVRGIAEHVFGLTAVMWNHDTNDWAMPNTQTAAAIAEEMEKWLSGPKNPGLMILEHELSVDTANVFINTTWAGAQKYGWRTGSVAQLYGGANYANAKDNLGPVEPVTGIETMQQATGTVPLPTWMTGSASTSFVSASAPADTGAPAPPADTGASAPPADTGAPVPPADTGAPLPPANTDSPVDTNTQSPADGETGLPHGGGGAGVPAPSQTPSDSNDHTSPPKTSGSPGAGGGGAASQNSGSSGTTTTPGDAAGIVRPQLVLSAVVAAAAFLLFA